MHPNTQSLKICILGAGMGGLTTALALARAGFSDITVFEMASSLGFVGAGIQMAPNMARILDRLGVWQEIAKEGVVLNETSIRQGSTDSELGHVDLKYIRETYGYPHMVGHRATLAGNSTTGACENQRVFSSRSQRHATISSLDPDQVSQQRQEKMATRMRLSAIFFLVRMA